MALDLLVSETCLDDMRTREATDDSRFGALFLDSHRSSLFLLGIDMASTAARRTFAAVARRQTPACARSFFSLPGFPSPFGSSASSKPAPDRKGTLVKEGDIWVYREDKVMP